MCRRGGVGAHDAQRMPRYAGGVLDAATRPRREMENLVGCFINTLVLRTRLAGNPTVRELLGRVRETCLDAYAHQDLPFEKLVELLRPERRLDQTPLFQVMLAPQDTITPGGPQAGSITFEPFDIETGTSKLDLVLSVNDSD